MQDKILIVKGPVWGSRGHAYEYLVASHKQEFIGVVIKETKTTITMEHISDQQVIVEINKDVYEYRDAGSLKIVERKK